MKKFFADAAKSRIEITKAQAKAISNMYKGLSGEIAKERKLLERNSNVSSILRSQYLSNLSHQIDRELQRLNTVQETLIRRNMKAAASAVVQNNEKFLSKIGLSISGAYSHVPNDIVAEIATGQIYQGRWNLSTAIWKNSAKHRSDIQMIVAKGVAGQKSTYEIAKDLEDYLNPAARKDWQWSKVYPGTSKVVDYNAQRLARTMVSHAYQDSFVRTTKNNPFIEEYIWLASGGDRMCEVCAERDGKTFSKDELPLDHPNGMCTFEVVTPSYDEIGSRLADWVNGDDDPEIDRFARDLGYTSTTLKSKVR